MLLAHIVMLILRDKGTTAKNQGKKGLYSTCFVLQGMLGSSGHFPLQIHTNMHQWAKFQLKVFKTKKIMRLFRRHSTAFFEIWRVHSYERR